MVVVLYSTKTCESARKTNMLEILAQTLLHAEAMHKGSWDNGAELKAGPGDAD